MLTAVNKEGTVFNLAEKEHQDVLKLRNMRFYCPACKESLVLKAGTVRIPHFAHRYKSQCVTTEPESTQHLQGKKDLFRFCSDNGFKSFLEQYLPRIQQRPDVLAIKNRRGFALEYQCTPIPIRDIQQRSNRYFMIGITPVWIVGGYPYVKKLKNSVYVLSDYYWSLTKRTDAGVTLTGYEPADNFLYILSNIVPLTSKKAFARLDRIPLYNCSVPLYLQYKADSFPYFLWFNERKKWIKQKVRYGNIGHDRFLKNVYESGNNPFLLPAVCGLPVLYMESFGSHPIEWQFYIWTDCLHKLDDGKKISLKYIFYKLQQRIDCGDLLLRNLPLHPHHNWKKAVSFYMNLLVDLFYLRISGEDLFVKQKTISKLSHMEDRTEEENICNFLLENSSTMNPDQKNNKCFLFGGQEK